MFRLLTDNGHIVFNRLPIYEWKLPECVDLSLIQSIERTSTQWLQVPSARLSDLSQSQQPQSAWQADQGPQERRQRGVPTSRVVKGTNTNLVLYDGNNNIAVFQRYFVVFLLYCL